MSIIGTFIMPHPPLIIPEVGKGRQKEIQKTIDSCYKIGTQISELMPDTIVLITPHSIMYADYFHISPRSGAHGDLSRFGAPDVKIDVEYDTQFVEELTKQAARFSAGTMGERDAALDHGAMIPLSFIKGNYKLVRIGLSGLPFATHYQLGQCIACVSDNLGRNTVIIASGDLSHKLCDDGPYGFSEEGPLFDRLVTDAMSHGDFLKLMTIPLEISEKAAECGLRSFIIMAGALDEADVKAELLSYEGPFGVGYAVASFIPCGKSSRRRFLEQYLKSERERMDAIKNCEDEYVRLARHSLESYVNTGSHMDLPTDLSDELLKNRAGVFVCLKKHGNLRGCIGTISPVTGSVAAEIIRNAVSAGMDDHRFDPVTKDELDQLIYTVDVLSPSEPIASEKELDVKCYGVIVTSGHKRGLLLPNLDGVDTVEQQISIAMQKAGINSGDKYTLERFEVIRHK